MERTRQRVASVNTLPVPVESSVITPLSPEQQVELEIAYSELSPEQINCARLESTGISDRQTLATQFGKDVGTITSWRNNSNYQKIVKINLLYIQKVTREFRVDCSRQIIRNLSAEMIQRTNDPSRLAVMDTKDIADMLVKFNKEVRIDCDDGLPTGDFENDIMDLQRRRQLLAKQQIEIERLKNNSNIVELPESAIRIEEAVIS